MRKKLCFNTGWKFHLGELIQRPKKITPKTGTCGGASNLTEAEGFIYRLHPHMAELMRVENGNTMYHVCKRLEDSWADVQIPHDWSIETDYVPPQDGAGRTEQIEGGYLPCGVGYYRKVFTVPEEDKGKRIIVEFEGVMRDAVVWVNGCYIGSHLSGYTGFAFDLSEYLFYGGEGKNVILVKADNTLREGWWAEGAGIYRDVWLHVVTSVHVKRNGVFIYSNQISESKADVNVRLVLENVSTECVRAVVRQRILDGNREVLAAQEQALTVDDMDEAAVQDVFHVKNPKLWNIDAPELYTLQTGIWLDGVLSDQVETVFGIRSIEYRADGLYINGVHTEIRGVCEHQDFAGVGAALTEDILTYKLLKIKELGANAYRCAHNPASNVLLSLCDRMGILVLNENRRFEVSEEGLEDLRELIEGSRNHPCIFMWSLENEELISTLPNGRRMLERLVAYAHKLDPTRQVTVAGHYACRDEKYTALPDVAGFNYDMDDALAMKKANPNLKVIASEDGSYVSTRRIYEDNRKEGWCDSYDGFSYMVKMMMEKMNLDEISVGTLGGAMSPNNLTYAWNHYRQSPFLGGMFLWSAFDYRGETFPWNWPAVTSQYGAMDACGFEKDCFYYWQSLWSEKPVVHVLSHWNWEEEGQEIQIDAYSNCEQVELWVNDICYGKRDHEKGKITSWKAAYVPGILCVKAYQDGNCVAVKERITADTPFKIRLTEVFSGYAQSIIRAEIVDQDGNLCPKVCVPVCFAVAGGTVAGTGNGNPAGHEKAHASECSTFNGLAMAIIHKTERKVCVSCTGENFERGELLIGAENNESLF